jgi:hypothetical protein
MPFDSAYRTVSRDDFPAMLEIDRYAQRSPYFEEIIARSEEHFWNPEDPDYIDFSAPPPPGEPLLPFNFIVEAHTAVLDRLDEGQKIEFANTSARWTVSGLLHGEQGAALFRISGACAPNRSMHRVPPTRPPRSYAVPCGFTPLF